MWNFCARIADTAGRFADRTAIELLHEGRITETSYAGLMDGAARAASWLGGVDVRAGDRVAILADNEARWISAYLGTLWIGAVAVPLDTAYKPAQVCTILGNSGARVLFTTPKYLDTAKAACAQAGGVAPRLVLLSGDTPGIAGAADLARAGAAPPIADVAADDAAVILYTSGTTSDPKGVVLTHANLDAERLAAFAVVSVNETDAVLGVLPLFHALAQMANLLLPLSVGARVVFLAPVSSTTLLEALDTRGITIFACVPQFFYLIHQRATAEVAKRGRIARGLVRAIVGANVWLRDHAGANPGKRVFARVHRVFGTKMRFLVTGGSKFDPEIGRDLYGMGFTLLNAYGLTETSGARDAHAPRRSLHDIGRPAAARCRDQDRRTDDGECRGRRRFTDDGEILIRGPVVMREYFGRADATAESIKDGWLYTGDLGRLDADGRLYITGRSKEIIVLASGKNLYPEEIEAHYRQSPFIKELCVLGLEPAGRAGRRAVARGDRPGRAGAARARHRERARAHSIRARRPVGPAARAQANPELRHLARAAAAHDDRQDEAAGDRAPGARARDGRPRRRAAAHGRRAAVDGRSGTRAPDGDGERAARSPRSRDDPARRQSRARSRARLDGARGAPDGARAAVRARASRPRRARRSSRCARSSTRCWPRSRSADEAGAADDAGSQPWDVVLRQSPDPALIANLDRGKTRRAMLAFVVLGLAGLAMRVLLRFRTSGQEHLPPAGPFIISPNHQAFLDGFVIAAALPYRTLKDVFLVGAAEYFATPFTARLARLANIVPVDPDANLVTAMQAGAAGLRMKKVLVLFPEGERSIDGDLKTFRKGAAILSSHLDAPIVPVALDGLYDLWPRGRPFNWRGLLPWRVAPVTVQFGAPIPVARGDYAGGTQALRDAVEKMLTSMRSKT